MTVLEFFDFVKRNNINGNSNIDVLVYEGWIPKPVNNAFLCVDSLDGESIHVSLSNGRTEYGTLSNR